MSPFFKFLAGFGTAALTFSLLSAAFPSAPILGFGAVASVACLLITAAIGFFSFIFGGNNQPPAQPAPFITTRTPSSQFGFFPGPQSGPNARVHVVNNRTPAQPPFTHNHPGFGGSRQAPPVVSVNSGWSQPPVVTVNASRPRPPAVVTQSRHHSPFASPQRREAPPISHHHQSSGRFTHFHRNAGSSDGVFHGHQPESRHGSHPFVQVSQR